jgi:hypothetical protein
MGETRRKTGTEMETETVTGHHMIRETIATLAETRGKIETAIAIAHSTT